MSHHQSTIQFHDQNLIHINFDLSDDDDDSLDDEFDSDRYDVYDEDSEVYDDEIDDIEEEDDDEDEDELNEMVSVLDLDDGVVVNGDGGLEEGLVSVFSSCGRGDGLICPICFEGWTSGGQHQMCCLPCGHIYGLSCINKWLQRFRGPGKCPQCKNLCTLKDVRVLYASRLCVADEELHERVCELEAKCADLEAKFAKPEQQAASLTPEELIDQICSNPELVKRLAAALAVP